MENSILGEKIKYANFKLFTYKVEENKNGILTAIDTDYIKDKDNYKKEEKYKTFNFKNYIGALYASTIKNTGVKIPSNISYIDYNGNYLIIIENGYEINKIVFDLRETNLPKQELKQIEEMKMYTMSKSDNYLGNKFIPILQGLADDKITSLITEDNANDLKSFYEKTIKYVHERCNRDVKPNYIPGFITYCLILIQYNNQYDDNKILFLLGLYSLLYTSGKITKNLIQLINNKVLDNDLIEYIDNCIKIYNEELTSIEDFTTKIAQSAMDTNTFNTNFYLTASRDLMVLNCYKDKSLNKIKIELISLLSEFIQYRSIKKDDLLAEELFMNKLIEIEKKIDLTNKELNLDNINDSKSDQDKKYYIDENCIFDQNNNFIGFVPIEISDEVETKEYNLIKK